MLRYVTHFAYGVLAAMILYVSVDVMFFLLAQLARIF